MATLVKGFRYVDWHSPAPRRRSTDIERMSHRARKAYLNGQLHQLDAQIGFLVDRLADEPDELPKVPDAAERMRNQARWSSLFSLGYLMAEREALAEAIDRL